jgi:sugar lactone lactonase YvrE
MAYCGRMPVRQNPSRVVPAMNIPVVGKIAFRGACVVAALVAGVSPLRVRGQASQPIELAGTYDPPYTVTTVAGFPPTGNPAVPQGGNVDGAGGAARFNQPFGTAVDSSGNVYVADTLNNEIRKIAPAAGYLVTTLAGSSQAGSGDGTGGSAGFDGPQGVAVDGAGNVYVADTQNNIIRMVTPAGVVSTIAGAANPNAATSPGTDVDGVGPAARFNDPTGIAVDGSGNLYVADCGNETIRRITPLRDPTVSGGAVLWSVTTIAGGTQGNTDGVGAAAEFNSPIGIAVDRAGNLYVADQANNEIRMITPTSSDGATSWVVTTLAGGSANPLALVPVDGANDFATFNSPTGVAVDTAGNVYVTDAGDETLRRIAPTTAGGVTSWAVTTLAGGNSYLTSIELGGPATGFSSVPGYADGTGSAALFNNPCGIAVDGTGNVYVADANNNAIRVASQAAGLYVVAEPMSQNLLPNAPASFVALVSLANSTYQWEVMAPGSSTWVNLTDGGGIVGSAASVLTVSPAARFNGSQFECVVTSGSATVTTTPAELTSSAPPAFTPYAISRMSGTTGTKGSLDGSSNGVLFGSPNGVAADSSGNVYVADTANNAVREIAPSGAVTTLAGGPTADPAGIGTGGSADGTGPAAQFNGPSDVAVDSAGNVYVADTNNNTIRMIAPGGVVTTLAGTASYQGGSADGAGAAAQFNAPCGVAVDAAGNVYVADTNNDTIRMIAPGGVVTTLAGTAGQAGGADGTGSAAEFNQPCGIAVDSAGNLYVADTANDTIRRIVPVQISGATTWVVTTLAGQAGAGGDVDGDGATARFAGPEMVAVDGAGNLYVTEPGNADVRRITQAVLNGVTTATVSTLAGTPAAEGYADGAAQSAKFNNPWGVAVDASGNLYVGDVANQLVRLIAPAQGNGGRTWTVATFAGTPGVLGFQDGIGIAAQYSGPRGVAADGEGNLFLADTGNDTIREISAQGAVTTLAGTAGQAGGVDGTGAAARFNLPGGLAVDSQGNIYVADTGNDAVREISSQGAVVTLAGTAGQAGSADGSGAAARFNAPGGVAVDSAGNVYVADTGNDTVREISPQGAVSTLAGMPGQPGSADGTGSAAQFDAPGGVAVDGAGNVYVADTGNNTVREIAPGGAVTTLAGTADPVGGGGDGTGGAAQFNHPGGIAVDSSGNVYVADTGSSTLRRIAPGGVVTTLGGDAGQTGSSDGVGGAAQFNSPSGVAADGAGNVYVADTGNETIREGVLSAIPYIYAQPQGQIVNVGSTIVLSVLASGNSALSYQWDLNGTPLSGETGSTLAISNVQASTSGTYTVTVTGAGGKSVTSNPAYLAVGPLSVTTTIAAQPIPETITKGSTVTFMVNANGSMQQTAAPDSSGDKAQVFSGTTYQWKFNGKNLSDGHGIHGAQGAELVIEGATASDDGDYTCVVTTAGISNTSNAAGLEVVSTRSSGTLTDISARADVGFGSKVLSDGFTIAGSTSRTVLIQALGPALAARNIKNALPRPFLTLHQTRSGHDVVLYSNTGWGSNPVLRKIAAAAYAVPVLQPGSADSELLVTLPPGSYTAKVSGESGDTGVAICAIYQLP